MPTPLPSIASFTDSAVTEGGFKTALGNLRGYLASLLGESGSRADALVALGALVAGVVPLTSTYIVDVADRGRLIDCNGSFALRFYTVDTYGPGFAVFVKNSGTGVVVMTGSGGQTIDGASSVALGPGESALVVVGESALATVCISKVVSASPVENYQVFTSNGTFIVPDRVYRLRVWPAGGAGGSYSTTDSEGNMFVWPGGDGGVGFGVFSVNPGDSFSVVIGAGGVGYNGTLGYPYPGSGGSTSFGSLITATGGAAATLSGPGANGTVSGSGRKYIRGLYKNHPVLGGIRPPNNATSASDSYPISFSLTGDYGAGLACLDSSVFAVSPSGGYARGGVSGACLVEW